MRRPDIDLLRILLCGTIILVHALAIFSSEPHYHLKSATSSAAATLLFDFLRAAAISSWFVVAGWSAVTSLRARSPGRFVKERVTRLLVPLAFGIVIFGSIIKYIELNDGRDMGFHGLREAEWMQGILQIDPPIHYFNFFPYNLTRLPLMSWSHLWFLAYLFLISIALLPLLVRLARRVPRAEMPSAFWVYLPILPMAALLTVFHGYWPYFPNLIADWTNFSYFALCFVLGAGGAAWPGFEARIRTEAPRLLTLMLMGFVGLVLFGESTPGRACIALVAWGGVGAGFGFMYRLKPARTRTIAYLSEATLPVYIVHHVPLLLIGIVLLPLAIPVWLKILTIWLATMAGSLAAYHCLIRPWAPARWIMGMAAISPQAGPTTQAEPDAVPETN